MYLNPHTIAYALAAVCGLVCALYIIVFMQSGEERDAVAILMWLVGALMYLLIAI